MTNAQARALIYKATNKEKIREYQAQYRASKRPSNWKPRAKNPKRVEPINGACDCGNTAVKLKGQNEFICERCKEMDRWLAQERLREALAHKISNGDDALSRRQAERVRKYLDNGQ